MMNLWLTLKIGSEIEMGKQNVVREIADNIDIIHIHDF